MRYKVLDTAMRRRREQAAARSLFAGPAARSKSCSSSIAAQPSTRGSKAPRAPPACREAFVRRPARGLATRAPCPTWQRPASYPAGMSEADRRRSRPKIREHSRRPPRRAGLSETRLRVWGETLTTERPLTTSRRCSAAPLGLFDRLADSSKGLSQVEWFGQRFEPLGDLWAVIAPPGGHGQPISSQFERHHAGQFGIEPVNVVPVLARRQHPRHRQRRVIAHRESRAEIGADHQWLCRGLVDQRLADLLAVEI